MKRTETIKLDSINEIETVLRMNLGGEFKRVSKKVNGKKENSTIYSLIDGNWTLLIEEVTKWNKFNNIEMIKTTRYNNTIPVMYELREYEYY